MFWKISPLLLLALYLLLFTGCPNNNHFEQGQFPYDPVNFESVNSEFDDYNSTAPFIEDDRYLLFSSNRNNEGENFDIVGSNMKIFWDKGKGELTVDDRQSTWKNFSYTDTMLMMVNTGANELGPNSVTYFNDMVSMHSYTHILTYAHDPSGNLDLHFTWYDGYNYDYYPTGGTYHDPQPVVFLNSEFNDAYLTFYGQNYADYGDQYYTIPYITEMLFCSDRTGQFDIFTVNVPGENSLIDFLSDSAAVLVSPTEILNSSSDDKCPYVNGELLVFASNRPGGYGGFDLYFSQREGENWTEPKNFGERINTEYDEYRPIVLYNYEFVNEMMIFSSNRPGGQGGYDLYYVGIPQMSLYRL